MEKDFTERRNQENYFCPQREQRYSKIKVIDREDKFNIGKYDSLFDGSWFGNFWSLEIHNYYTKTYSFIIFNHEECFSDNKQIISLCIPIKENMSMLNLEAINVPIEIDKFDRAPIKFSNTEFKLLITSGDKYIPFIKYNTKIRGLVNISSTVGKIESIYVNTSNFESSDDVLMYLGYCRVILEKELSYGKKRKEKGYSIFD